MKITKTIRLDLSGTEGERLLLLVRRFNDACNWLSTVALEEKSFSWLQLQRWGYRELRDRFGLSAAQAVVAVRKVAYAYSEKTRRDRLARFRPLGGIPVHRHQYKRDGTVRFYGFRVQYRAEPGFGPSAKCEAKLIIRGRKILLQQIVEVDEPAVSEATDYLGVDLGVVNIASDSDHERFAGGLVNGLRKRHSHLRRKLQKKGTRSATRLLVKRRKKESLFARHVNHTISKELVAKAHGSGRGIALEDLKGIRARIKARKAQRRVLHSWSFGQLRSFIEYKARLSGVEVRLVDPRNTSRTCPRCGLVDKRNRRVQWRFKCVGCSYAGHANFIAAENIRRAVGNQPHAAMAQAVSRKSAFSSG